MKQQNRIHFSDQSHAHIGKMGIPDSIFQAGCADESEYEISKPNHHRLGDFEGIPRHHLIQKASAIALNHHDAGTAPAIPMD